MSPISGVVETLLDRSAGATITGFAYQFDFTIMKILQASESSIITVEGLEDVDVFSLEEIVAVQVKYLTATTYSSPKILRDPILSMLRAFAAGMDNKYILHVYFGQGENPPTSLTADQLKECLTKTPRNGLGVIRYYEQFEEEVLTNFCSKLEIRTGVERHEQQSQVIRLLSEGLECDANVARDLYYPNALALVQELAMLSEMDDRQITRSQFVARIEKKKVLYGIWHREAIGETKFIKTFGCEIKQGQKLLANRVKGIVLAIPAESERDDLLTLLEILAFKDFGIGKLHSAKPWTVILEGERESVKEIKKLLLTRNIVFHDGYEDLQFHVSSFDQKPVMNLRGISGTIRIVSYDMRIISLESFREFSEQLQKFDTIVVTTGTDDPLYRNAATRVPILVEGLNIKGIMKLLEACK